MLSFQFKTCITNGRELYAFIEEELNDQQMSTRATVFPESLLSFLYLDIEQMRPVFQGPGVVHGLRVPAELFAGGVPGRDAG